MAGIFTPAREFAQKSICVARLAFLLSALRWRSFFERRRSAHGHWGHRGDSGIARRDFAGPSAAQVFEPSALGEGCAAIRLQHGFDPRQVHVRDARHGSGGNCRRAQMGQHVS